MMINPQIVEISLQVCLCHDHQSSVDLGRGRKLGKLGNLRESVFRGFSLQGFHLQVFGFGTVQNRKLGVEKPRKNILRVFRELPVFDLTVDLGY